MALGLFDSIKWISEERKYRRLWNNPLIVISSSRWCACHRFAPFLIFLCPFFFLFRLNRCWQRKRGRNRLRKDDVVLFRLDVYGMGCELWLTSRVSVFYCGGGDKKVPVSRFQSSSFSHTYISAPWKGAQEVCMCVWMYINMVANKITGHEWVDDGRKRNMLHMF